MRVAAVGAGQDGLGEDAGFGGGDQRRPGECPDHRDEQSGALAPAGAGDDPDPLFPVRPHHPPALRGGRSEEPVPEGFGGQQEPLPAGEAGAGEPPGPAGGAGAERGPDPPLPGEAAVPGLPGQTAGDRPHQQQQPAHPQHNRDDRGGSGVHLGPDDGDREPQRPKGFPGPWLPRPRRPEPSSRIERVSRVGHCHVTGQPGRGAGADRDGADAADQGEEQGEPDPAALPPGVEAGPAGLGDLRHTNTSRTCCMCSGFRGGRRCC